MISPIPIHQFEAKPLLLNCRCFAEISIDLPFTNLALQFSLFILQILRFSVWHSSICTLVKQLSLYLPDLLRGYLFSSSWYHLWLSKFIDPAKVLLQRNLRRSIHWIDFQEEANIDNACSESHLPDVHIICVEFWVCISRDNNSDFPAAEQCPWYHFVTIFNLLSGWSFASDVYPPTLPRIIAAEHNFGAAQPEACVDPAQVGIRCYSIRRPTPSPVVDVEFSSTWITYCILVEHCRTVTHIIIWPHNSICYCSTLQVYEGKWVGVVHRVDEKRGVVSSMKTAVWSEKGWRCEY